MKTPALQRSLDFAKHITPDSSASQILRTIPTYLQTMDKAVPIAWMVSDEEPWVLAVVATITEWVLW